MSGSDYCPMCRKIKNLHKVRIFIGGNLWYVYICDDCFKRLLSNKEQAG